MQPFDTLGFILGHPLSKRRPISAIFRYARWQIESRFRDEIIVDWLGGAVFAARHGRTGITGNIYCRLHEFREMTFLLHLLRPGDTFVDIGANVGSYTILASRVCGARSIAFEPDRIAADALRRNVALNRIEDLVCVHQTALGAHDGELLFTVGLDTMNRAACAEDCDVQTVPVRTPDGVEGASEAVFAKLDVEGFETRVLTGAKVFLHSRNLLAAQSESFDDEVCSLLTAAGFRRMIYEPFARELLHADSDDDAANALFVRDQMEVQKRLSTAPKHEIYGCTI